MCEIICPQIILVRRNYGISLVLMIYIYIIYIYISSLKKSFSLFMTLFPKILFRAYFKWLLLKPGLRKTWTLKNLDSEKPGLRKTWTLKYLGPEKSENHYEKRGKQLDAAKRSEDHMV